MTTLQYIYIYVCVCVCVCVLTMRCLLLLHDFQSSKINACGRKTLMAQKDPNLRRAGNIDQSVWKLPILATLSR